MLLVIVTFQELSVVFITKYSNLATAVLLGGGGCNLIGGISCHAAIAGGCNNSILASNYSGILSGRLNEIYSSSNYSSILGGLSNCVSGEFSSILGGQGNLVTHQWASASGYNVASVADCTFHVNCLNACDTPLGPGTLPSGTIFYSTTPISGGRALYIVP